ncbi:Rossmann-like and DUF2520 domain-containing protein [Tepidibacillus sp. HK-1]|uniref:Rossmann-like and DUF2520 domain-containing protein n=1 Tax=Tepidibacillus sp. HK-1 TaxID=1883407 RepID=UPI0008535463|nr:Rossmann-like and DUF2520 domain-containing protein [Tepidibacillus sp. HK-1]GBF10598.1 arogenate dehydrogenase [Tepidibacillus sp. HK-1]
MKIGFIGAGKVGTSLGEYWYRKGFQVVGYYTRTYQHAVKAASKSKSMAYQELEALVKDSDLIAISVNDDQIASISEKLASLPIVWENKIVFHLSGLHTSNLLSSLWDHGATVCSLHPMLSFSDPEKAVIDLQSVLFTIEGRGKKLGELKSLLDQCGNSWMEIRTDVKALYHTAATILSNYLVTLVDIGVQMLTTAGFKQNQTKDLIEPLVKKTIDRVIDLGTEKALTGPISRGDMCTLEKHLEVLGEVDQTWLDLYQQMGFLTIDLAKRGRRITSDSAEKMKEVLISNEKKKHNSNFS